MPTHQLKMLSKPVYILYSRTMRGTILSLYKKDHLYTYWWVSRSSLSELTNILVFFLTIQCRMRCLKPIHQHFRNAYSTDLKWCIKQPLEVQKDHTKLNKSFLLSWVFILFLKLYWLVTSGWNNFPVLLVPTPHHGKLIFGKHFSEFEYFDDQSIKRDVHDHNRFCL